MPLRHHTLPSKLLLNCRVTKLGIVHIEVIRMLRTNSVESDLIRDLIFVGKLRGRRFDLVDLRTVLDNYSWHENRIFPTETKTNARVFL